MGLSSSTELFSEFTFWCFEHHAHETRPTPYLRPAAAISVVIRLTWNRDNGTATASQNPYFL
jgi:hypothetical protein